MNIIKHTTSNTTTSNITSTELVPIRLPNDGLLPTPNTIPLYAWKHPLLANSSNRPIETKDKPIPRPLKKQKTTTPTTTPRPPPRPHPKKPIPSGKRWLLRYNFPGKLKNLDFFNILKNKLDTVTINGITICRVETLTRDKNKKLVVYAIIWLHDIFQPLDTHFWDINNKHGCYRTYLNKAAMREFNTIKYYYDTERIDYGITFPNTDTNYISDDDIIHSDHESDEYC